MIRSLQEVDTLMSTIRKVDKEISRRRLEITRNIVPNAGLARQQVEALVRDNNQRKAYLRVNSGHIEALRASGARFTPLRTSFVTPDGPKHKGNKRDSKQKRRARENFRRTISPNFVKTYEVRNGKYYFEGKEVSKAQYMKLMEPIRQRNITKKQRKKTQGPMIPISAPMPIKETIAKPRQFMQKAADSIRNQSTVLAKQKEQAIRKQRDTIRDAELVKQGKADLVLQRKVREKSEQRAKAAAEAKRYRAQITANAKKAAAEAEKKARAAASKASQVKNIKEATRRSRARIKRSIRRRGNGFLPQMIMLTALNDKKRSQVVNNATRSPGDASQIVPKDQITEDIRQHKPITHQHSKGYLQIMSELQETNKMAKKELESALRGQGMFGNDARVLGIERTQFWVAKGYSILKQVNEIVSNEALRWEKGSLNAGVAISTDTRSQSTRQMTKDEFDMYIQAKLEPILMNALNEYQEELMRAHSLKGAQLGRAYHRVTLGNSLPVNKQRSLASADKARGHGRPVLSEQQGTQGLAGLFPALRSSMQGVLHR